MWCYALRFDNIPHYCHTLCVSPVESVCMAYGGRWVWSGEGGGPNFPRLFFFIPFCFLDSVYLFRFLVCYTMLLLSCLWADIIFSFL